MYKRQGPNRRLPHSGGSRFQIPVSYTHLDVYKRQFKSRANWTLAIVCDLILREWSYGYTQKGVADLLHRLGLSWTRPTVSYTHLDVEKDIAYTESNYISILFLFFLFFMCSFCLKSTF
ncbi:winged helix-turn-helix domain-containing protein [Enterococcus faecium]|uniref:winged helix-turn-helix domain-containing protein n=1 Tax=Enterococcus faecium TaxID=1352 RepID=UPI0027D9FDCF|nr:winged helix-turn-helix domain-containing protein [Enterococcus faecium]